MNSSQSSLQRRRAQEAADKVKNILLTDPETIRARFGTKPITLLRLIDPGIRFPKKLRIIFACLWLQQDLKGNPATRFIMKGPRGGGKSKMLGALGFVKFYLSLLNVIDMGGSLMQAQGVYNYFIGHVYAHDSITNSLPSEPTMHRTESDKGNYFKAVAASQKQVRGPHPDNLYIDEACETKDELILSALPMVDTSPNPLVVLTSTFHKIFGLFQEIWDQADKFGYVRLSWDIFDVTASFDPAVWDELRLNDEIPDLALLKERAAGRSGDPEGWVPVENIIQAWREKPSIDYFDVEYMGSRPSAAGMVNDPEDVDACTVPDLKAFEYRAGAECAGGLDWGFQGMTAWDVEMAHKDQIKVQVEMRIYTQVRSEFIIKDVVADVLKYRMRVIHADGSHPFENADLRAALARACADKDFRCTLVEIPFGRPVEAKDTAGNREKNKEQGTEKDRMLGNYRAYFQRRLMRIPKDTAACQEAIWQHKRYRYQKNSDKPLKEDDHCPDAKMLALRRWPLGKVASALPKTETPKRGEAHSTVTGGLLDERF